jgi:hypothetical protein
MRMLAFPSLFALLSALILTGCQQGGPGKPGDTAAAGHSETDDTKIEANLAQLTPEDRLIVEEQKFCPIMNAERLGSMGPPVKVVLQDEPVFVCCKKCQKKAEASPERTLVKAKELRALGGPKPVH